MVNKTNLTPNNNNTFIHLLMKIALSFGVVIGSGIAYGFAQIAFHPSQTQSKLITCAEYEQLKIGMTITDVRSILGRGIEVNRSATTATFIWQNLDHSKITITFESDRLKSKEQSALK